MQLVLIGILIWMIRSTDTLSSGRFLTSTPEYLIHVWETEDGLPENSATCMTQTPDGYLWFGTFNGLVRFNGQEMKVYDTANTPGFSSTAVIILYSDSKGRLWISADRGGLIVHQGEVWKRIDEKQGWHSRHARCISEDSRGHIVVVGNDSRIYRIEDGRAEEIVRPPGLGEKHVFCLYDSKDILWLGSDGYLARQDADGKWNRSGDQPKIVYGTVLSNRKDGIWVVEDRFLKKLVDGREVIRRDMGSILAVWSMLEDRSGNVWISTYNRGIVRVSPDGTQTRFSAENGLTYDAGRFVFEDTEGVLWVGTSGGGLHRFKPRRIQSYSFPNSKYGRVLKSVLETADGEFWVGTYGVGLAALSRGFLTVDRFPKTIYLEGRDAGFPTAYLGSILQDARGRTWIGRTSGLGIWDGKETVISPPELNGWEIFALFKDSRERIWIGGDRGLASSTDGLAFQIFGEPEGIPSKDIRCFAEDRKENRLWVGTLDQGLFCREGDRFRRFTTAEGLNSEQIHCLYLDPEGKLWVGMKNGAVAVSQQGRFLTVDERHGLPTRNINSILEDDQGILWMGTNRGILRVPRRDMEAAAKGLLTEIKGILLDITDGMDSVEVIGGYQNGSIRDRQGRLWFCTMKGLSMIDPRSFRMNGVAPRIHIEEVSYYQQSEKPVDSQSNLLSETEVIRRIIPPFSSPLELPAGSKRVEFHYTALSYGSPEKTRYRVMLEGHDPSWIRTENRRIAFYHNLSPGEYRFRVRGTNDDGIESREEAGVRLIVAPFYWQTAWFRLLLSFGLIATVVVIALVVQRSRLRIREERLRQQEILNRERIRFATLMQHASDVILLQNKDGRFVYESLSASRMFGYPQGFFLGKRKADLEESDLWKLIPSEDIKDLGQLLQRMRENRDGGLLYHVRFRHAAGNWLDLEVLATNLLHQPDVEGILITIRDVSERRRAEQIQKQLESQLRQAQKMEALGTLAGGIAHDFNNILGAIVGFTWLARSDLQSPSMVEESLEQISQASDRAIGLVKQILTFSRQGKQERMKMILQPVIKECLKLLRSTLPAAIEIRSEIEEEPLMVMADPTQIHQVMMNLCTNAAHAMKQKSGFLLVGLQCIFWKGEEESTSTELEPGTYALITVRDTGHGMDENTLKRIFDPFFTTKAPGEGTGLGLAVVHGIVKDHRGAIEVKSEPGVGTAFQIYLPLAEASDTTREKQATKIYPGRGERILYVDDEPALCRSHRIMLQKIGYEVTAYSSPVEVLSHLRKDSKAYNLVITDFNMPGMSGLELAVAIGKMNPDLPMILVSGHLGVATRELALKSGICEVLAKPLLPEEVSVVLDRILHASPSRETE